MLESKFQNQILKPAIKEMLPGCVIMKNDENTVQGIPDLLVLYENKYAMIECKRSATASFRPNQKFYLDKFANWGTLSLVAYPENLDEVLDQIGAYFHASK